MSPLANDYRHTHLLNQRYRLQGLLGSGGMGQVYRAFDRLSEETVALKQVTAAPLQTTSDPQVRLALTHEFQALASLRHPHIIAVRDYGFDQAGRPYFSMELLHNARPIVAAAQFQSPQERVDLLLQILYALAYIHRRGIIHRDLKPGNILVSGRVVKVLDFGLATIAGQVPAPSGTLRYMAPEMLRGEPATIASDLYAVGVIGYELFAGWHPFAPTGQHFVPEAVLEQEPDWTFVEIEPPLLAVLRRLLAKQPADRYQDAPAVIAALGAATGQPLPVETAATRESFLQAAPFTGRQAEVAQLTAALAQATTGQPGAWLVSGESGVGKSRLLNELRTLALVQGVQVVRGGASSTGGAYQLWPDVLRWLVLLADSDDLAAAVLKPLVPDIANLLGRPIDAPPPLEPKAAQARLLTTVTDLLRRSTRQQPLLLLLEDLHWADDNSLELLRWLNRIVAEQGTSQLPLLIVATYRQDEAPQLPAQMAGMQLLPLQRLSPQHIATLSEAMLGETGRRPHLVDFLQQETEGNTFFVVEVLRALAEEVGQLDRISQMTLPSHVFPGGIQGVVLRRLQRIPAAYTPLMRWAAIAGRQLDLDVLAALASTQAVEAWLTVSANAAVIEVQDDRWQFSHDKLREGILLGLEVEQRQQQHRQIAATIEQVHAQQLAPYYADLAYHYAQAADPIRERDYVHLAGEAAQATYANSAAIEYYERLLTLLDNDRAAQVDVLLKLGVVLQHIGRWEEAEQRYRTALQWVGAEDVDALARCYQALGVLQRSRGDFPGALDWLQQAQVQLHRLNRPARLGEVLLELGNVYYLQGNYGDAWGYLNNGLVLAQQQHDQTAVASALHRLGSVRYSQGNYNEARVYAEQALALYDALENKAGMANARNNLGNIARITGDHTGAQTQHEASLALRRAIGDQWGIAASLNNLAVIPYLRGDYQTAQVRWEESLALRLQLGDRWAAGQTLDNLGLVAFSQGDYALARQRHADSLTLRRAVGDKPGTAISLSNLAHAELDSGDLVAARLHYQESLALSTDLGDKRGIIACFIGLAAVNAAETPTSRDKLTLAVQLLAATQQLVEATGTTLERDEQGLYDHIEATLSTNLESPAYLAAWAAGRAASVEEVIANLVIK